MEPPIRADSPWLRLRLWWRPIAMFGAVAAVLTAAVAFTLPSWYMATASLLPPTGDDVGLGIEALLDNKSLPSIRIPTDVTPADIFVVQLDSPRLGAQVVERFDLKRVYKRKFTQDAIKVLKKHARFTATGAGTITMEVEDTDPRRAAAMLRAYVEFLDQFNRELRDARSRRTRQFIEARLAGTQARLAKSEQALADYQAKHKEAIITSAVSTASVKSARIFAQRFALQTRLGVILGYSRGGSQEERQIEDEIAQLDLQLAALPQMRLQLVHLLREVKTYGMINALLTAEYEDARIKEARNAPMVELLDEPATNQRSVQPHRWLLMLLGVVLGLAVGAAYCAFQPDEPELPAARARVAGA